MNGRDTDCRFAVMKLPRLAALAFGLAACASEPVIFDPNQMANSVHFNCERVRGFDPGTDLFELCSMVATEQEKREVERYVDQIMAAGGTCEYREDERVLACW